MSDLRINFVTLTVLSDESIDEWDIARILEECDTGRCVMGETVLTSLAVTREHMNRALIRAGSDPEFFKEEEGDDEAT